MPACSNGHDLPDQGLLVVAAGRRGLGNLVPICVNGERMAGLQTSLFSGRPVNV